MGQMKVTYQFPVDIDLETAKDARKTIPILADYYAMCLREADLEPDEPFAKMIFLFGRNGDRTRFQVFWDMWNEKDQTLAYRLLRCICFSGEVEVAYSVNETVNHVLDPNVTAGLSQAQLQQMVQDGSFRQHAQRIDGIVVVSEGAREHLVGMAMQVKSPENKIISYEGLNIGAPKALNAMKQMLPPPVAPMTADELSRFKNECLQKAVKYGFEDMVADDLMCPGPESRARLEARRKQRETQAG